MVFSHGRNWKPFCGRHINTARRASKGRYKEEKQNGVGVGTSYIRTTHVNHPTYTEWRCLNRMYIFMLNKYVEGGSHTYTVQTHTFHRQHINNNPRVSLRSGVAVSFVLFAFYVGFIFVCFDNESIIDKCASDNSHFAVLVLLRCATVWYSSHFESTASVFYYVAPISHHALRNHWMTPNIRHI